MLHANVVLCRKSGEFDAPLSYAVPAAMECQLRIGDFVRVPFRSQTVQGVVVSLLSEPPRGIEVRKIKTLAEVLPEPSLPPIQIQLALAMASYYHASLTKVLRTLVPSLIWEGRAKVPEKQTSGFVLKNPDRTLTPTQTQALERMEEAKKPVLLHGVTGSGKTELYLRLILKTVAEGKQALLLLPEIALTPQTVDYFREFLGDLIEVFHSRLTEKQRTAGWWRVKRNEAKLVIGSRSAVFAPFLTLGFVIIDEEHEWTYKQESAPYYQTHWIAEKLLELHGAKLLLGSATPRLESYAKAKAGEYELISMPERFHQPTLPAIAVVDLREEFKKKNFSIFSFLLQRKIVERLKNREQIILFVNQRGIARAVVCRDCGHLEQCPRCDISLKYHRGPATRGAGDRLICHYCGFAKTPPAVCPACQSPYIKYIGIGTQRVEEEVKKLFPEARVVRADRDTTKGKAGFEPIYKAFLAHEYDILIGTQMVAKGLDFERVSLIGIVLADVGMSIPDFRSHERLFQLITQVAGRCGRNLTSPGDVVLQTYQPHHPAVREAAAYGYEGFAEAELGHRQKFGYPPYGRLIKFTVVGSDEAKLHRHVQVEEETLKDIFKVNALPLKVMSAPALVPKVKNRYYHHVLVQGQEPQKLFDHWKIPKGWRADIDPIHTT